MTDSTDNLWSAAQAVIAAEIHEHIRAENAQDIDALLAGMTADCYNLIVPDPQRMYAGPEAVTRRYRGLWATFPDLSVTMRRILSISDTMAISEHMLAGTQKGALFGFAPTGRRVNVETIVVWEIVDGRVKGETVYFDVATMLRQIGALN